MVSIKPWKFEYGTHSDGTPKIEGEMEESVYEEYKRHLSEIENALNASKTREEMLEAMSWFVPVELDETQFEFISQNSDYCQAISYPCKEDDTRTFATSGEFPIMAYVVLKYFKKQVTLQDLAYIANYGEWHHKNGTYHHFLDVVIQAYGLKILRVSSFFKIFSVIAKGGIIVSLMDQRLFPHSKGNTLILVTKFSNGDVYYYTPAFGSKISSMPIDTFVENTKVLWSIENM